MVNIPRLKKKLIIMGGGRYKGQTKCESWDVSCPGCSQMVLGWPETEEEAIAKWNENVMEDRAKRDAPDKLIYKLENSTKQGRALARLLKDIDLIKKHFRIITKETKNDNKI